MRDCLFVFLFFFLLIVFPKSLNQNYEIAILFGVVKKPYNYVFGDDLLPTVPMGGATSSKL